MSFSDSFKRLFAIRDNFGGHYNNSITANVIKNAILSAYDLGEKDYENCLKFLNGELKYTPDEDEYTPEVVGKSTILSIADLKNPFDCEFDLSACGIAGKYLTIKIGFRKKMIAENANKIEICLTPWFMVEKNISGIANHLEKTFGNWNGILAPFGMFWNNGSDNCMLHFDYLTHHNLDTLSTNTFQKLWKFSGESVLGQGCRVFAYGLRSDAKYFHKKFTINFKK